MFWPEHFKLGLFPPNVSGGMVSTAAPERWEATWADNLELAVAADDAGLDFLLPASRWIGYGGRNGFQKSVLETMTWASAVLARTRRITVFSTVYAPLFHPIMAAMQMATADQVGAGRFGLNLVCGWRPDEFAMFGIGREWHDSRYDRAAEWIELVRRLWSSEEPFDFDGEYYVAKGAQGHPKPYGGTQPLVMNAGYSPAGRRFAARHVDFLFTNVFELDERSVQELRDFRALAADSGRPDTSVCVTLTIVSRETRAEAEEYVHHYAVEHADWEAVDILTERMGVMVPEGREEAWRRNMSASSGLGLVVGSHDEVADRLAAFAEAGYAGAAVGLVNYLDELPVLRDEILPRLEARGVRRAA
ncbi:FMNH(2)-dependent dimethylsulfone monooxygenase [Capillimicrobium parvum]|uniref:FMNH(2)-dependent dimethylsulfone monooxygenase n=2 Tax=Capillimicrobium parvum TaxID=2884022 RepID=A0A9E6XWD8_9ACTN|nr:FMNH(2)-dependent dimethylsulfone monooxygenase [Capillimicrobium parvum]